MAESSAFVYAWLWGAVADLCGGEFDDFSEIQMARN
jgi:hypothetical protein